MGDIVSSKIRFRNQVHFMTSVLVPGRQTQDTIRRRVRKYTRSQEKCRIVKNVKSYSLIKCVSVYLISFTLHWYLS